MFAFQVSRQVNCSAHSCRTCHVVAMNKFCQGFDCSVHFLSPTRIFVRLAQPVRDSSDPHILSCNIACQGSNSVAQRIPFARRSGDSIAPHNPRTSCFCDQCKTYVWQDSSCSTHSARPMKLRTMLGAIQYHSRFRLVFLSSLCFVVVGCWHSGRHGGVRCWP